MPKEIIDLLNRKVCECEQDLRSEEDFLLEEVPTALDGIKWFVQEWLPNHAN